MNCELHNGVNHLTNGKHQNCKNEEINGHYNGVTQQSQQKDSDNFS